MPREYELLPGETFEEWFKRIQRHVPQMSGGN